MRMVFVAWVSVVIACKQPPASPPSIENSPRQEVRPTVLADVPDQTPFALAVDQGFAYWSDRIGGGVWRVPTTGGTPQQLAKGLEQPRWIVSAFGKLYVATETQTVAFPEVGGPISVVAPERDALTRGSDGVYIASGDGRLVRIDARGSRVEIADHLPPMFAIAVAGTSVIATAEDHGIWKITPGAKPTRLATLSSDSIILAVFDGHAYVEGFEANDLMAVPIAGGEPRVVLPSIGETASLAVDEGGIWWTSMVENSVYGSSIAQPAPRRLFGDQSRATAIVTDHDALYWIDWKLASPGEGRIMRAPKPRE
jgi:hypothetical protein